MAHTSRAPLSPPPPSFACSNASDVALWNPKGFRALMTSCETKCRNSGVCTWCLAPGLCRAPVSPPAASHLACVFSGVHRSRCFMEQGLSSACSTCFSVLGRCTRNHCARPCFVQQGKKEAAGGCPLPN